MTTGLSDRLHKTRRAAVIATSITLAAFQLCGSLGLRINTSPSLPMGLYITTADANANLVEFCPVEPIATLSRMRGYRAPGTCGDGADPLLKPIVAKSGDVVEVSALGISVNGYLLHNTAPLSADTKGRHLKAWPPGHYVVAPGTIWVASSYHPGSFDSRYFGPVATAAIRHRLKAFLTL